MKIVSLMVSILCAQIKLDFEKIYKSYSRRIRVGVQMDFPYYCDFLAQETKSMYMFQVDGCKFKKTSR